MRERIGIGGASMPKETARESIEAVGGSPCAKAFLPLGQPRSPRSLRSSAPERARTAMLPLAECEQAVLAALRALASSTQAEVLAARYRAFNPLQNQARPEGRPGGVVGPRRSVRFLREAAMTSKSDPSCGSTSSELPPDVPGRCKLCRNWARSG